MLCVGDSLTSGFYCYGTKHHPYSRRLEKLLRRHIQAWHRLELVNKFDQLISDLDHVPSKTDAQVWEFRSELSKEVTVEVREIGRDGDITENMVKRLSNFLGKNDDKWDIIAVMGGTNDIAKRWNPKDVIKNLKSLLSLAKDHGAKTVAMTVPRTKIEKKSDFFITNKHSVNTMLRGKEFGLSYDCLLDVGKLIAPGTERNFQDLYDDKIHFTPVGYDRIADIMFDLLCNTPGMLYDWSSIEDKKLGDFDRSINEHPQRGCTKMCSDIFCCFG